MESKGSHFKRQKQNFKIVDSSTSVDVGNPGMNHLSTLIRRMEYHVDVAIDL